MKAGIVISISVACIFLVAAFGGFSCGPDRNLYGHWEGDRDWHSMNAASEEAARAFAAVNLDLKPDGSFLVIDGGVPITGSWTQHGASLDLRPETIMNKPMGHQAESLQKMTVFVVRYEKGRLFFRTVADSSDIELKKKTKP